MKLKRILALAVSLAMILSIVPAFEFTASAAYTIDTTLPDDATLVFNGGNYGTNAYTGTSLSDATPATAGTPWSKFTTSATSNSYVNLKHYATSSAIGANDVFIQFYRGADSATTDNADNYATILTSSDDAFAKNSEWFAVQFFLNRENNAAIFDFGLVDADGKTFSAFEFHREYNRISFLTADRIWSYTGGSAGTIVSGSDLFTGSSDGPQARWYTVFVRNYPDENKYTVTYAQSGQNTDYSSDDVANNWTEIATLEYSGQANGFSGFKTVFVKHVKWSNVRLGGLRVYAGSKKETKDIAVSYVDENGNEIADSTTVSASIASTISLTDETVAPHVIEKDGTLYARDLENEDVVVDSSTTAIQVKYTKADEVAAEKTAGMSWFAIEYTLGGSSFGYADMMVADQSGSYFTDFVYAGEGDGIWPGDRNNTGTRTSDNVRVRGTKWTSGTTKMRIVVQKTSDTTYNVKETLFDAVNVASPLLIADLDYSGSVNGIAEPSAWKQNAGGAVPTYENLKIYAVVPASSTEETVKAALDLASPSIPKSVKVGKTASISLTSSVTDSLGGTFDVAWVSADESIIDAAGNVTYTGETVTSTTLTPTATLNGETVSGSDVTVYVFPASRAGTTYTVGSAKYTIGTNNLIENGSFGEGDSIDLTGWYAHTGDQTNAAIFAQNSSETVVPDGKWAYGSEWSDPITGTNYCTIDTMWPVEAGSNYLSFYARTAQNEGQKDIYVYFTTDNTHHTATPAEDQQTQLTLTNEWQKFEFVFSSDVAGYVGFTAYNLSSNSNGNLGALFDDFELYEAEASLEAKVQIALNALSVPSMTKTDLDLPSTITVNGNTLDVTWTTSNANVIGSDGKIKDIADASEVTLTPTAVYNGETFTGNANTVTVFLKDYEVGAANFEYDGVIYDVESKTEFDYDWVRRTSTDGSTKTDGAVTETTNGINVTTFSAFSVNNTVIDDARGTMAVEGGKTYVLRFYYGGIAFGGDNKNKYNKIFTTDLKYEDEVAIDYVDGTASVSSKHTTANVWEKKEIVFTASSTANYLTFVYSWLGAGMKIADINLYEIQKSETYHVQFVATDGTVIKEVDTVKGKTTTLSAGEYTGANYFKYVVSEDVTATSTTEDCVVDVLASTTGHLAPSTAFTWNFTTKSVAWAGDSPYTAANKDGIFMVQWGNVRHILMKFPIADLDVDDEYLSNVYLTFDIEYVDQNNVSTATYAIYAVNPEYVGDETVSVTASSTSEAITALEGDKIVDSTIVGSYGTRSVRLPLKDYFVQYPNAKEVALLIVSEKQAIAMSSATGSNPPYLVYGKTEFTQNSYGDGGGYVMKNNVGFDTPLNEIFMLGAHDSMVSAYENKYDPGMDASEWGLSTLDKAGLSLVGKDYYITQNSNIITLLNSGVRYIDVRLTRYESGSTAWYATHTKIAGFFGNEDGSGDGFAQEIVNWLHDNPGEVLIFDLQWVYDVDNTGTVVTHTDGSTTNEKGVGNAASFAAIARILSNTKDVDGNSLYDYIYNATGKSPATLTYGQVTNNGAVSRLVGLTKSNIEDRYNGAVVPLYKFMWRGAWGSQATNANVWSEWSETSSVDTLKTNITTLAESKSTYANMFRVMQAVLANVKILSTAPSTNSSIYGDSSFLTWLDAMPIFMVDYADTTTSVSTLTSATNNGTGFSKIVTTDFARFNRAKKFGFSDYSVDHQITFTDSDKTDPVVMVTGSNFELPISILLHVDNPEGEAPDYAGTQKVTKKIGVYAPEFRRFVRTTTADDVLGDLGTSVTISFNTPELESDLDTFEVLQLVDGSWTVVDSTYDNSKDVVTLTNTVTNISNTYMLVEVESAESVSLTLSYRDTVTDKVFYSAKGRYNPGNVLYSLEASGDNGYYIVIGGNAYIIKTAEQSHTVASEDDGQTIYADVELVHENAVLADAFWTANGKQFYGSTDGNHLFIAADGNADMDNLVRAEGTDADGENLYNSTSVSNMGNMSLGTARFAVVQYNVPEYVDGNIYTLTLPINSVHVNTWNQGNSAMRFVARLMDAEYDVPDVAESSVVLSAATAIKASGDSIYSDWVTNSSADLTFDITDAVKTASDRGQKTMTFKLLAAYGGIYLNNLEITTPGGDKEGLASYIDVTKGNKITVEDGTFITKNGTAITESDSVLIADSTYKVGVKSDGKDDTMAYVTNGKLYVPDDNDTFTVDSPEGNIVKATFDVSMVDGAQVRVGNGVSEGKVPSDSGLRFIASIDTSASTGIASLASTSSDVEFGIAITAEDSDTTVYVPCEQYQDDDNTVFTAVLTNLNEGNYNRNFTATPYVKVGDNTFTGSTSVKRSIYQVSAGILSSQSVEGSDTVGSSELSAYIKMVLNTYINKVGIRLGYNKSATNVFTARTSGSGAYTGDVFFSVVSEAVGDGTYNVTVTLENWAGLKLSSDWMSYIRVNNNNSTVISRGMITNEEVTTDDDGVTTLTFNFNPNATAE